MHRGPRAPGRCRAEAGPGFRHRLGALLVTVHSRGRADIRSQNPSARPGFRPEVAEKNKTLNSVISRLLSKLRHPIDIYRQFHLNYSYILQIYLRICGRNEVKSSDAGPNTFLFHSQSYILLLFQPPTPGRHFVPTRNTTRYS